MTTQEREQLDVAAIREDFPILDRDVDDGTPLVYLDNAATSQTPDRVIDAMSQYYREYNSNVHRGIHQLSMEASIEYEDAHDRIADFIGATGGREEIVFTKNTTEAINLVAQSWGVDHLGPEDAIVITEMEHHASLVTWQQIAERTGAELRYARIDDEGRLDMDHAAQVIDSDVSLVGAVHVSNTLGTVNPLADLADLAHEQDAVFVGDGAQAVANRPVDVEALDVDFYAFSGHKMAGPTGIGVLYGKRDLLESMDPFLYGGEMIERVTFEESTWADLPWKFEAGTMPIAEAIGLAEAVDYLDSIGMEQIRAHERAVTGYLHERLHERNDVETYGPPPGEDRAGLVSFNLEDVHAHDLSSILNEHGVAVRAGDHCTQPLHDRLGVPASTRASIFLYNTREEIDVLLAGLDAAVELFR
ncbi:MAG: cysteine desulfurase [Halodesulfurarchaeum sp.]